MIAIFDLRSRRRWALAMALCSTVPARADPIDFGGGNGSSEETAVVIRGAANEVEGIAAEHAWQARHHPSWRTGDQAVLRRNGRMFDLMRYQAPDGPHELWFDITSFYGKL